MSASDQMGSAVVTGAASGIGAAVCRRLLMRGITVWAIDCDEAALLEQHGNAPGVRLCPVDVTDSAAVDEVVAMAAEGSLQLVVHAAGVDDPLVKSAVAAALQDAVPVDVTARMSDASWRRMMAVNLDGTFHVVRAAVAAMKSSGGSIVVIGSSAAIDAPVGFPHYSASKAAVHAFCQSVAKEVSAFGIRVNVIAPGPTDTKMASRTPAAFTSGRLNNRSILPATPEEIADNVEFLASTSGRNVVGAVLLSNGGRFTR